MVAAGNHHALGILYQRYSGSVFGVAARVLGNGCDAEDLVHDVFVEAWQKAGTYDPTRGTVRSWFHVRARCRALDRLRSPANSRLRSLEEAGLDARPAPESFDPSLAPDQQRVREALSALRRPKREVVELAYFGGLSSSEIAERLGLPVGTVKSRVRAGVEALRLALGQ